MQGYVQLYIGDGKGKTSAALGLALRALGAGLRVCFVQFLKGRDTAEIAALARFGEQIHIVRCGRAEFIACPPSEEDCREAAHGLDAARTALLSGQYDVVILDEILSAWNLAVINEKTLLGVLDEHPDNVELVLTGRSAPQSVLDRADLVSDIRKVRHYFDRGVAARRGIEY